MKMPEIIENEMIAPCGVNCMACMAYLREKNKCNGCNGSDENKPYHCTKCKIKYCDIRLENNYTYCYECDKKCQRIKQLDKRYIKNYEVSLLENLENLKTDSSNFLAMEISKWGCRVCGGIICQHTKICSNCKNISK